MGGEGADGQVVMQRRAVGLVTGPHEPGEMKHNSGSARGVRSPSVWGAPRARRLAHGAGASPDPAKGSSRSYTRGKANLHKIDNSTTIYFERTNI